MKLGSLVNHRIAHNISKNQPNRVKTVSYSTLGRYPTLPKKRDFWIYSKLRCFAGMYDLSGGFYVENWPTKHIPLRQENS